MRTEDFTWDEFFWLTHVILADRRLAAGPVCVTFAPEGRGAEPLLAAEVTLVEAALGQLDDTIRTALNAVFDEYPRIQLDHSGFAEPSSIPDLEDVDGLCDLVELIGIFVHPISRDGRPYVGLEFSCPWDPEHGLGVLVNGSRVVETGGGDTALLLWIAQRDLDRCSPGES